MTVVNAADEERSPTHERRRGVFRQDHAPAGRERAGAALGAGADGQPRTLPLPRTRGSPVRADRALRGLFSDVIADQVMGYVICYRENMSFPRMPLVRY